MTSILPPNATPVARDIEALATHVRDLPVPIAHLWTPAACPAAFLPWLAWSWSVTPWRSDWPEATKRAVIAAAPRVHRLKGTVAAVRAAVAPFGQIAIREWWQTQPPGRPHTFELLVMPRPDGTPPAVSIADMVAAVRAAKPARSHFTVVQPIDLTARLAFGLFVRPARFDRFSPTEAL